MEKLCKVEADQKYAETLVPPKASGAKAEQKKKAGKSNGDTKYSQYRATGGKRPAASELRLTPCQLNFAEVIKSHKNCGSGGYEFPGAFGFGGIFT